MMVSKHLKVNLLTEIKTELPVSVKKYFLAYIKGFDGMG